MEKMFVYPETLDRPISEAKILSELELVRSRAATVSYRCKVYRASLEQGAASQIRTASTRSYPNTAKDRILSK
jgi:hypothetical protein